MKMIENNPMRDLATPFVIFTERRTGGTYLAHCLSNHPQIFCARGEPLHHASAWVEYVNTEKIVRLLCNQTGYRVSGFKLLYGNRANPGVRAALKAIKPRIIHLVRRDKIAQAASLIYNTAVRTGRAEFRPQHTFEPLGKPTPIYCPPADFSRMVAGLTEKERAVAAKLHNCLTVTYEDITAGGDEARRIPKTEAHRICEFLGVDDAPLFCELRKVNSNPALLFSNWDEIQAALEAH